MRTKVTNLIARRASLPFRLWGTNYAPGCNAEGQVASPQIEAKQDHDSFQVALFQRRQNWLKSRIYFLFHSYLADLTALHPKPMPLSERQLLLAQPNAGSRKNPPTDHLLYQAYPFMEAQTFEDYQD